MTGTTHPGPVRDEHHSVGELVGRAEQHGDGLVRAGEGGAAGADGLEPGRPLGAPALPGLSATNVSPRSVFWRRIARVSVGTGA